MESFLWKHASHTNFLHSTYIAEPPRITTHPQEFSNVVQGKPARFTVQATGADPLSYQWEWKPAEEEGGWLPCPAEWCDGAKLMCGEIQ